MNSCVYIHSRALAVLLAALQCGLIHGICNTEFLGDGWCDSDCNTRDNRFDGGDCCERTCTTRPRLYPCGVNGYNCLLVEPVPSWFRDNTELCYKWRADGDGGQCGAGEPNELCAHVGQYTLAYRDDTDRRSGGCRMQWGLRCGEINLDDNIIIYVL